MQNHPSCFLPHYYSFSTIYLECFLSELITALSIKISILKHNYFLMLPIKARRHQDPTRLDWSELQREPVSSNPVWMSPSSIKVHRNPPELNPLRFWSRRNVTDLLYRFFQILSANEFSPY